MSLVLGQTISAKSPTFCDFDKALVNCFAGMLEMPYTDVELYSLPGYVFKKSLDPLLHHMFMKDIKINHTVK